MDETFHPKPRAKKATTEKQVESDSKKRVASEGGLSLKFTSPGRRAVPDQIELYGTAAMLPSLQAVMPLADPQQVEEFARRLLARAIQFTECKRPGKKPTAAQEREHARLRALGFQVNVLDHRSEPNGPIPQSPRRRKTRAG
jgi:hypothetical protein